MNKDDTDNEGEEDVDTEEEEEEEAEAEAEAEAEEEGEEDQMIDDDDDDEIDRDRDPNYEDDVEDKPSMSNRDIFGEDDDDDGDDDELNENYLQKLDTDVKRNIISEYHPELNAHNMEEVETSCTVIRDTAGYIVDPFHRTIPFVTRYEKARVIGERAKQINSGAKPFVEIDKSMIDGYLIALKEFDEKKIPFIIRRPLPNGASEYWRLADLEIIA